MQGNALLVPVRGRGNSSASSHIIYLRTSWVFLTEDSQCCEPEFQQVERASPTAFLLHT